MILYVKLARPRSGRPRFSVPSRSRVCILRQCHTQDTQQLCCAVLCLFYLLLLHQQLCDSTNSTLTTTSTKTKLPQMSQTMLAPGRIILIFQVHRIGEFHSTHCFLTSSSMEIRPTTTSMEQCSSMMLCELPHIDQSEIFC